MAEISDQIVAQNAKDNLYGTTQGGGPAGYGVVYRVDPAGHEIVLHGFAGRADGANPGSLIRDSEGNLYGTTFSGGKEFAGVVFKLGLRPGGRELIKTDVLQL